LDYDATGLSSSFGLRRDRSVFARLSPPVGTGPPLAETGVLLMSFSIAAAVVPQTTRIHFSCDCPVYMRHPDLRIKIAGPGAFARPRPGWRRRKEFMESWPSHGRFQNSRASIRRHMPGWRRRKEFMESWPSHGRFQNSRASIRRHMPDWRRRKEFMESRLSHGYI